MLRYDKGKDWVEIATGVARLPMRKLVQLEAPDLRDAHAFAVSVTQDASFTDDENQPAAWRTEPLDLSPQQWSWWKDCIWKAARDEKIDPEA